MTFTEPATAITATVASAPPPTTGGRAPEPDVNRRAGLETEPCVMRTGRAAILEAAGQPLRIDEVHFGAPGSGEVLVRLVAAGVCHSDVNVMQGVVPFPLPGILGHEGAGIVEQVGPGVRSVRPGDKVVLSFSSCGSCAACAEDHPAYCSTWIPRNVFGDMRGEDAGVITRDGKPLAANFFGQSSFGSFAIADEQSTVKVSDDADLVTLAPLGCGVLTGFGSMWNVLKPAAGDIVAVYGAGAVGLSGIIAASLCSPSQLIAIDVVDERLELASALGATATISGRLEDVAARIAEITEGHGVDKSFDTTANPRVARTALDVTAIRGTVLVGGAAASGTEIPVDIQSMLTGKVLRGVTMGDANPHELIPRLVTLHAEKKLPLEKLQRRYSLDELNTAAQDICSGATIKPVIVF